MLPKKIQIIIKTLKFKNKSATNAITSKMKKKCILDYSKKLLNHQNISQVHSKYKKDYTFYNLKWLI